jgi:hypothetical protein
MISQIVGCVMADTMVWEPTLPATLDWGTVTTVSFDELALAALIWTLAFFAAAFAFTHFSFSAAERI